MRQRSLRIQLQAGDYFGTVCFNLFAVGNHRQAAACLKITFRAHAPGFGWISSFFESVIGETSPTGRRLSRTAHDEVGGHAVSAESAKRNPKNLGSSLFRFDRELHPSFTAFSLCPLEQARITSAARKVKRVSACESHYSITKGQIADVGPDAPIFKELKPDSDNLANAITGPSDAFTCVTRRQRQCTPERYEGVRQIQRRKHPQARINGGVV